MAEITNVRKRIGRHLLTDGMKIIIDLDRSEGSWLVDQRDGSRYLDCFSMYASMAVGYNHPELLALAPYFGKLAVQKPSNSDAYSEPFADFVDDFARYAMPEYLPHCFFIEGGALAVENALKAAFDWKVQKNFSRGCRQEFGHQIIHFRQAFHGRSGYTLSLTNTADPRKTKYFPKFSWPRIINPKRHFPESEERLREVIKTEQLAVSQIKEQLHHHGQDLAAIIIEPIQGEGGDNHFRQEFLAQLREICDQSEMLLIFDEVQTGVGLTGKFWAHQHFSITPDLLCFGKKTQVCGMLGSRRLDETTTSVFTESSRINSTFGGNLVDMARCSAILEIIDQEKLLDNAAARGRELLRGLTDLAGEFAHLIDNPRGRGLMCAFDCRDGATRDEIIRKLREKRLLVLGCGERGIRFRPHLIITPEEVSLALCLLGEVLSCLQKRAKATGITPISRSVEHDLVTETRRSR
jgi:L-lysine 6-transaminase